MSVGFKAGLEDVVAATSAICTVDGKAGQLRYRGYDIGDLVESASFEEVIYLLWFADLPRADALAQFTRDLSAAREVPPPVLAAMGTYPRHVHPLEALRTAVSLHAMYDPDAHDNSPEANLRKSVRLTAQTATLVAAWRRIREGKPVVAPDPARSHAANFLWMLSGAEPDAESIEAMDDVLVLHAEHELNASTFAARVAVATVSDLHSAVVAALGTLKGPRHGGANEDVLAMLQEIGTPDRAEPYVRSRLEALSRMSRADRADPKHRIPGFGHRVYKVDDPRAARLRAIGRRLAERAGVLDLAETAEATYRVMHAETSLPVNVDFFSAVIYHALGIPIDLCTSVFAVSRIPGWCAHIMEQYADNRLIRPRAEYTGPEPRSFVRLAARR
ncbi:MAG: citrate synthase [Armatimonadetes bacterium]|nr:citrate synthase [Armatimonadota bacterium]